MTWIPHGQPFCDDCLQMLCVYVVFFGEEPKAVATRCPQCEPYRTDKEHFESWVHEAFPPGTYHQVSFRVPQDARAWEFARKWVATGKIPVS